eukprot:PhM_4_TR12264/c0_g1_i1/m.52982
MSAPVPAGTPPPPIGASVEIQFGVAWDPTAQGDSALDLDLACSVFDACGLMLDTCFYNNLSALGGAIVHSGDSRDGMASGIDEAVYIRLGGLPAHAMAAVVSVHCFEHGSFANVESSICYINVNGQPYAQHPIGVLGNATSGIVMTLTRQRDGTWVPSFQSVPLADPIRTPLDALPSMLAHLRIDPETQRELQQRQPVYRMSKGDQLRIPANMHTVGVGLGWDSHVDVDASAICLDAKGVLQDLVYYGQLQGLANSIRHSGDNRTGEGAGDDEVIGVDLGRIPPHVTHLFFVVNVYSSGHNFRSVHGEYCRLMSMTRGQPSREFCRAGEMDNGGLNGFIFAVLYRDFKMPQWWQYAAVGEHASGNVAKDLVDECQDWQRRQFNGQLKPPPSCVTAKGSLPRTMGPRTCRVVGARNLKACDSNGLSDPYVKVFAMPGHTQIGKTEVVKKTLTPTFKNASFKLPERCEGLEFIVMDKDTFFDDKIGVASLTGSKFAAGQYSLSLNDGSPNPSGMLLVELF